MGITQLILGCRVGTRSNVQMLTATVDPLSHHDLHILFGRRAISDGASVSSLPSIIKPMNGALMATNTLPQEMDACKNQNASFPREPIQ